MPRLLLYLFRKPVRLRTNVLFKYLNGEAQVCRPWGLTRALLLVWSLPVRELQLLWLIAGGVSASVVPPKHFSGVRPTQLSNPICEPLKRCLPMPSEKGFMYMVWVSVCLDRLTLLPAVHCSYQP